MNNGYKGYTDEELIVMLRDGDTAVTDFIMEKYKNLVRSKAKSMFIIGGDEDDLIQEGMIGLFKAIRDYDSGRDASFFTFAELCISRQMYNAVQASGRKKHGPLNSYVSLYSGSEEDEDDQAINRAYEALDEVIPEHLIGKWDYSTQVDIGEDEVRITFRGDTGIGKGLVNRVLSIAGTSHSYECTSCRLREEDYLRTKKKSGAGYCL